MGAVFCLTENTLFMGRQFSRGVTHAHTPAAQFQQHVRFCFVLFFLFPAYVLRSAKRRKKKRKKRELFLWIAVANSSPCSLSSFPPLTLFFVLCGLLSSPAAAAAAVVITATVALLRTALFYTISATTYTKAPRSHILSLLFSTLISLFFSPVLC